MLDRLNPLIYFIAMLPFSLFVLALGYRFAARYGKGTDDKEGWPWALGHAAMFGLISLILAFSYSRAADRFEARGALVVNEANAIRAAYLRAGFLPTADALRLRNVLIAYARTCLDVYAAVNDAAAERRAIEKSEALQDQLWTIASGVARRDTRRTFLDLSGSVIEIIDIGERQTAAFNSHVPGVIIGLVVLSTLSAAFLFGLSLGRANAPNAVLAAIFCLLFSATFFTILDLDHAQGGLIGVDLAPMQSTLRYMTR
jgi:hypothetical protein